MTQVAEIEDWDDFEAVIYDMDHRQWVFRGQVDAAWDLESSLYRVYRDIEVITKDGGGKQKAINRNGHEKAALHRFRNSAHLYLTHLPRTIKPAEWFAQMQHYGAPTRLLDFTFSPYVAAFFAFETGTGRCAVYCFQTKSFKKVDQDIYGKELKGVYRTLFEEDMDDLIMVYEPRFTNPRLLAQQGCFLIPGTNEFSHEEIVDEYYDFTEEDALKLVFPPELRMEALKRLRAMNINSSVLFPELEGLCRSLRHQSLFPLEFEKQIGRL